MVVFERGENRGVMNLEGCIVFEVYYDLVEVYGNGMIEVKVLLWSLFKVYM